MGQTERILSKIERLPNNRGLLRLLSDKAEFGKVVLLCHAFEHWKSALRDFRPSPRSLYAESAHGRRELSVRLGVKGRRI